MDSIGQTYNVATSENKLMFDLVVLLSLTAGTKCYCWLVLWHQSRDGKIPHPGQQVPSRSGKADPKPSQSADANAAPTAAVSEQAPRMTNTFAFVDCNFKVKQKQLLTDVSAFVHSGEVLAIMGPSGAGKTTLLNMLTLRKTKGGSTSGTVKLNETPLTKSLFTETCYFVEQGDILRGMFTVKEHVELAATLRPNPKPVSQRVQEVLRDVGLTNAQNVRAGNEMFKGISGGQKRRLSVAIAITQEPSILFLDEPTTGLDSVSAAAIMKLMKSQAVNHTIAVLCTIHQPSSSVFAGFDLVLLLSAGKVAYFGSAGKLKTHLGAIGFPVPENTNPVEFALDLVDVSFGSGSPDAVISAYLNAKAAMPTDIQDNTLPPHGVAPTSVQIPALFRLLFRQALRDPLLYTARLVMFCAISTFFSVIYIDTRNPTQDELFSRQLLNWWNSTIPTSLAILPLVVYFIDRPVLGLELRTKLYYLGTYVGALVCNQIPFLLLLAISSLVPAQIIGSWPWISFGRNLLAYFFALLSFEVCALFFSLDIHPVIGLLNLLNLWLTGVLMEGFMIPITSIIWPFRFFCYILPLRWATRASNHVLFIDDTFDGAISCIPSNNSCSRGFTCPNISEILCMGFTGEQVLNSFNINYEIFTGSQQFGTWILNVALFTACSYVLYCVRLRASLQ